MPAQMHPKYAQMQPWVNEKKIWCIIMRTKKIISHTVLFQCQQFIFLHISSLRFNEHCSSPHIDNKMGDSVEMDFERQRFTTEYIFYDHFFVWFDWQYFDVFLGCFRKRVISKSRAKRKIPINWGEENSTISHFTREMSPSNSQSPSNILPN